MKKLAGFVVLVFASCVLFAALFSCTGEMLPASNFGNGSLDSPFGNVGKGSAASNKGGEGSAETPEASFEDSYKFSNLPEIAGIDWDALNTGKDASFLNDYEKEAIAWYNLAVINPGEFYRQIVKDPKTAHAKNDDLRDYSFTEQAPSLPSKALMLTAKEYALLYNSSLEFDHRDYLMVGRNKYVSSVNGCFVLVADLEDECSPKLFVAKVVKLCGEWSHGTLVAMTRRGNYGVFVIAQSLIPKADLPDTPTFNEAQISADATRFYTRCDLTDAQKLWVRERFVRYSNYSEKDTVRDINSWIHVTISYEPSSYTQDYSASGLLADIIANGHTWTKCNGYAKIMVGMLRACGVKARYLEGWAFHSNAMGDYKGSGSHAWVQAYVDGKWYMCDPTWNWVLLDGINGTNLSPHEGSLFSHSHRFSFNTR